ncbi:C_GCAxxG_C_C family protein [uncultured Eubacterium sp.]|nr:C_GCAxxG_C_C family protein [uncultured Eubacterium sp.]
MNRKEQAIELHGKGYNCAQSVVCPFCEELGTDLETAFRLSEAFGGGMGTFSTCGAVSGMAMVIGMKQSDGSLDKPKSKSQCYKLMKEATNRFLAMNKSTICREIKGMDGGEVLRSCNGCIEDAVAIAEELLFDKKED